MGIINVLWKGISLKQDSSNRLVSDTEKTTWNGKANANHNHDSVYAKKDDLPDFNVPRQKPLNLATVGITTKTVQNYLGTDQCPHVGDYWLTDSAPTGSGIDAYYNGWIVAAVGGLGYFTRCYDTNNNQIYTDCETITILPLMYYPNQTIYPFVIASPRESVFSNNNYDSNAT